MRPRRLLLFALALFLALAPAGARAEPFLTPFSNNAVPLAPGPFSIALSLPRFGPPIGPASTVFLVARVEVVGAAGSALDTGPEPTASAGDAITWAVSAPGLFLPGALGPVFALAGADLEPGVPLPLDPAAGPGSLAAGRLAATTLAGDALVGYLGTGSFAAEVTGTYGLADPAEPTALRVTGGRIVATLGVELVPFTIPPDQPAVPEPGTFGPAALGAAALGAGFFLRRKRRGRDLSRRWPA